MSKRTIYIYSYFWQSSTPGALNTLVTSVVLYSLTRATLMSPGNDETRVCGYIYIYGGERDSVRMSQRDMGGNCYMTG